MSPGATSDFPLSGIERDRREYRHREGRRSTLVAIVSTVIFTLAVWLAVVHTPGWPQARETFLNGHVFVHDFPAIARAALVNLKILVVAVLVVPPISLAIATVRTSTAAVLTPLRAAATAYIDLFRGCPLIILLYLFGVGIPSLQLSWLPKSAVVWGAVAIIVCYSAYVGEVLRAGILSVHPSQRAAARSLGLTQRQTLRIVVLPQAVRAVLPALLNDFIALQKDVGLISIVGGATDAIQQATIDNSLSFNFTPYLVAAVLFILLAIPSGRLADAYTIRAYRQQRAGAVA